MAPESFPQQRNTQEYPNLLLHPVCLKGSIAADSGSDALTGPGYRNRDASMLKKFALGNENRYSEVRFEAFHVFNHTERRGYNSMPSFGPTTSQLTNFQSFTTG
jgi:hypothetical protein